MANQEVSGRKVVYIVGPSSTGKTTLCTALLEALDLSKTAYVTEVARKVLNERGYTRNDVHRLEVQRDIMLAHIQAERLARGESSGLILCDRSAIDAVVYAILTASDERNTCDRRDQLIQMDEFQYILPLYRQSLFFLLEPVAEWIVGDEVRYESIENIRDCFETFQATLRYLGIEYRVIAKENRLISDRVAIVTKLVGS